MFQLRTMTTPDRDQLLELRPEKAGLMSFPGITVESARIVSELLQKNDKEYHGFYDSRGFHNHIVEDILAVYDFGATPSNIHSRYNRAEKLQRACPPTDPKASLDLADESTWHKYLGNHDHYSDFLMFFKKEMAEIGFQQMVNKRLFARTEVAHDLFIRCFSGIYHPIIRIGYALEFDLPGLIPSALATAAVSEDWTSEFFLKSHTEGAVTKDSGGKSLKTLLDEIHNDPKIRKAAIGKAGKLPKEFVEDAGDDIISYVKQCRVSVDHIDERLAESINISAFIAGASMRKHKEIKFDFILMHCITTSIFLTSFVSQDWITPENKARLLEWKGRFDLLCYAAAGAPVLYLDEIENYVPKASQVGVGNPWLDIIERGIRLDDDGHAIKTTRALIYGERISAKYRNVPEGVEFPIVGDMWRKIAAMCIDSVEGYIPGGVKPRWVRGTGLDEVWEVIGPRKPHPTSSD